MVARNLNLDEGWWNATMLAERDDRLFLHGLLHRMAEKIMRILLGLNRIYLPDVRFKWLDQTIAALALAPPDLAGRLKGVLTMEPLPALAEMQHLLEETFELVARQMPELAAEADYARRWMGHRRVVHHWRPGP
jgi:hypothetical protein